MTDLERRAMLGDAEAQRECTEKGIVLTCACCGSMAHVLHKSFYKVCCENVICGNETLWQFDETSAIRTWNTRPAPPIGRCGECAHLKDDDGVCLYCEVFNMTTPGPEAFCCMFEPKGGEENVDL